MDERAGPRDLRYLKWIGIVAPVVFLVALEAVHFAILDPTFGDEASNLIASGLAAVAAVGFGLVLFFHIEAAQEHTVQRNRDLAVVSAVSVAIQGELDVDEALQAALAALIREVRPNKVSIHLPAGDSGLDQDHRVHYSAPDRLHRDGLSAPEQTVEIPLATGAASIGHVRMTIPLTGDGSLPSAQALQAVGNQIAAVLQIAQLVGDLQRRKTEGHTLYQTLLQIGNQATLSDILATIVNGARDRLAADIGRICLSEAILNDFQGQQDLAEAFAQGVACQCTAGVDGTDRVGDHECGVMAADYEFHLRASIWSPGESFGELWIARRGGHDFSERDRGYLMTLAGLAAIAITAARLREHERQSAILTERDRIARELHDSMAQVLGATHLRLRALLARPDLADQPRASAELTELADLAEEAYRDVREAILGLREASRGGRGLVESLAAYLEKYSHQAGIKTILETTIDGELALPTDSEVQVIRVIQEALTNVRKHARATTARIRIASGEPGGMLTIVIEDDGRGFEPLRHPGHRDGSGYGLHTMRERVELVGGTMRIDSVLGRGTRIIAMVPMAPATPPARTGRGSAAE